ncbi:MAG: DUF4352 domain-containing protein [Anaerolineales bacterium]
MKPKLISILVCLAALLVFAACILFWTRNNAPLPATAAPTAFDENYVTSLPPTPASPGQAISYEGLQVTIDHAELSTDYLTEYGSRREPPADTKFLWVQVALKNSGAQAHDLPAAQHFSALYGGGEFKPTYGHRQGYADYTVLDGVVYPGQSLVAWLRFDVPAVAELSLLQFAYLPKSSRVTYSDYAWRDQPVFLWRLAP